jgi:hypothetical protein
MQIAEKPRWKVLCERASNEHDPDKLLELIKEINQLIEDDLAKAEGQKLAFRGLDVLAPQK